MLTKLFEHFSNIFFVQENYQQLIRKLSVINT